jgi:putative ATP-dependent endonuclease of the OLD family
MYISKVSLVNYRNFSNSVFFFNKGINTIIGENGAGKTNVFRAMRLLLEDASLPFSYKLEEGDFNRSLSDWRGHWIIISIEFDEVSSSEAIQSLFAHGTGKINNNQIAKASYNLFFRPKADVRLKLSELKPGDKKGFAKIIQSITINDDYETFFTGKSTVDFNDPVVYRNLVGDFERVEFNANWDSSLYGIKIPHQLSVSKEVSFTFIKALRDVVSDFHNNRTNPLLSLLKNKSEEINPADFEKINNLVVSLNDQIETLPDVQQIRRDIKDTIKDAVGETYSPSSLSIRSNLPSEANKLLQSLKLFIGEPEESYEGGIHELSLGGANLIFLTLKLLEYKYRKANETFANFLLIEEPEAHIHTHIQKTLFDKLDYGDTQIIYSTHSPQISEVSNLRNINILARKQNLAEVYQPSSGLGDENINELQRYLDAVRSNLLFAKGVILVEGDAEEILVPLVVKKTLGISLDELGISLINIRSTGFENVAQLFHEDRIRRKCSIITDLDQEICDTIILESDPAQTIAYKTNVANSSKAGTQRKKRLDRFAGENNFIQIFYADFTFEVDFVRDGNAWEVINVVDEVYKDLEVRKIAKNELKSEEISIYGKRVLTMANREGKGWFAILVGKHISHRTIIPDYIMKAIIFAKSDFSTSLINNIVGYRIDKCLLDEKSLDFSKVRDCLHKYNQGKVKRQTLIAAIKEIIPGDQIVQFLQML